MDLKTTRPRHGTSSGLSGIAPQLGFAGAVTAGAAVSIGFFASTDIVMPALATLLLLCAAGFGVIAWRNRDEDRERVTYADVDGALTLIGLFAAATIDPDQLLRIVAARHNDD